MAETEFAIILRGRYEELQDDSQLLNCLRNAGVEDWEGFDQALDDLNAEGDEG